MRVLQRWNKFLRRSAHAALCVGAAAESVGLDLGWPGQAGEWLGLSSARSRGKLLFVLVICGRGAHSLGQVTLLITVLIQLT